MGIDELRQDAIAMTRWEQHKFFVLIAGVILLSTFLVSAALSLYNSSGAAQLDLSRPGFQEVRKQATRDTTTKTFPATGALDKAALDSFSRLYGEQTAKVSQTQGFDAAALSEESLQLLNADTTANAQQVQ